MARESRPGVARRSVLQGIGALATAGSVTVAGCISGGDNDADDGADVDAYPEQEIEIIVPYAPGGGFDGWGRAISEYMPQHLPNDVSMPVMNVEGAGGATGTESLARSDPDGYTLGVLNLTAAITLSITEDTSYELDELSYVARFFEDGGLMVTGADSPYDTLEDMQNAEEPVTFGTTGLGGASHVWTVIATDEMGIEADISPVFTDGAAQLVTGVIAGDVDAMVLGYGVPPLREGVLEGDLEPVVHFSEERDDYLADFDFPTAADAGYADLAEVNSLQGGLVAPPGMDDELLSVIEESFTDTMESDEMQEWAADNGNFITLNGSDETHDIVMNTHDTYLEYEDEITDS